MFVGWDWASATHDVTVIDDAGAVVDRWAPPTPSRTWPRRMTAWLASGPAGAAAGGHRAAQRAGRRAAAGRRPPGRAHPPQRLPRRPAPLGCGRRQVRSRRQLQAGRLPAHRRAPAAPAATPRRSDPGAPGPGAAARRPCRGQDRGQQPARRAAGRALARCQGGLLPARLGDRARVPGRLPDPAGAARLGEARLAGLLPPPLLPRRPQPRRAAGPAPVGATPPVGLDPEVLAELVGAQVRLLRTLLATIADLERAMGAGLLGHAKAKLLAPMPRIGEVNLAQVLAEVGPILDRVDTAEQAAAECGAAPVTRASGKSRAVVFRWAANPRARDALATFADNSRHASPWAAELYADARDRGKRHPHAIRILARAWLRVMWACWHTDTALRPRPPRRRTAPRRLNLTQETEALRRPRGLRSHERTHRPARGRLTIYRSVTAEATGSIPVTPTNHPRRSEPHLNNRRRLPERRQAANRRAHSARPAREHGCQPAHGCSGLGSCWPARGPSPRGRRSPARRRRSARSHSNGEGHGTSAAPPDPSGQAPAATPADGSWPGEAARHAHSGTPAPPTQPGTRPGARPRPRSRPALRAAASGGRPRPAATRRSPGSPHQAEPKQ